MASEVLLGMVNYEYTLKRTRYALYRK